MKNRKSQLDFLFLSTLLAIVIWMASPSVKAKPNPTPPPFPLQTYEARYEVSWHGIPAGTSLH
ncbi:MAG: hypothetical protein ACHQJ6_03405, partial [Candidatus Berkiellales bacterium]